MNAITVGIVNFICYKVGVIYIGFTSCYAIFVRYWIRFSLGMKGYSSIMISNVGLGVCGVIEMLRYKEWYFFLLL